MVTTGGGVACDLRILGIDQGVGVLIRGGSLFVDGVYIQNVMDGFRLAGPNLLSVLVAHNAVVLNTRRGALFVDFNTIADATIVNSTLAFSSSVGGSRRGINVPNNGAIGTVTVVNSILQDFFNATIDNANPEVSVNVFDSIVAEPQTNGTGPINFARVKSDDARFVNPPTDLRLSRYSPALQCGDNSALTGDTDVRGLARVVRERVDLGAYERQCVET